MKWMILLLVIINVSYATLIRDDILDVVYDDKTNLIWQDNVDVVTGRYVWNEAIYYCEALDFANSQDWRVPNINELFSIVDLGHAEPAIDTAIFQNIVSKYYYWSSTTFAGDSNHVWNIYFGYGHDSTCTRGHRYYVRCVRDKKAKVVVPSLKEASPFIYYYLLN